MAELVNKTLEVVCALPLQSLEEGWVKECWDNHFLDSTPLPLATENVLQDDGYCMGTLDRLHQEARQWQEAQSDAESLWTCLLENNVSHKALVALLAHLMPMEHSSKTCRGLKKEAAFIAATVYVSLVGLPGSRAFKVYSRDLLLRAVHLLKANSSLGQTDGKKRGAKAVASSQRSSQSQPAKRSRNTTHVSAASQNSSNDMEGDESGDSEDDDDDDLTPSGVQRFHSLYMTLLSEVVRLLSSFSLRDSAGTIEQVVKVLTALTRVDNHGFDGHFPPTEPASRSGQSCGIAALAFRGLLHVCQPLHGDLTALTTLTCKYLLANTLMLLEGNKVCGGQTIPHHLQLGRQHAISFVMHMVREIGEPCLPSVKTLLQHMCMRVPDKAEYRTKAAQGVVTILAEFPDALFAFMLKWIGILSKNEKSTVRVFSLELLTLLLSRPERELRGVSEEEAALASHAVLVNQLLDRCSDVSAAVRAKAVAGFAQCLESGGVSVQSTIRDMITPRSSMPHPPRLDPTPEEALRTVRQADRTGNETDDNDNSSSSNVNKQSETGVGREESQGASNTILPITPTTLPGADKPQTPFRSMALTEALDNSLPDRQGVISMLRRRAREEKVFVRKAAVQAFHKFILFEAGSVSKEDMEVLCERCRDTAILVRKQALTSLTELLLQCRTDSIVQSAWLQGVMGMVWDQETTVQEKCLEAAESVLLCNIVPRHRSNREDHIMAWQLLTLIGKPENSDLRRHFKKMCRLWERQKKLTGSLVTSILSHMGTDNNQTAWSVLADVSTTKLTVDIRPVVQYWTDHSHTITGSTEGGVWEDILRIISFKPGAVSPDHRSRLIDEFKSYLLRFDMKPVLVSSFSTAIHQLSRAEFEDNFQGSQEWGRGVLEACDQYLSAIVLDEDISGEASYEEDRVVCYLYTLGVVALYCPCIVPKRVPMLVQSFIAHPCLSATGDSSDSLSSGPHPLQASQGSEVSEEGSQGSQSTQGSQGSQSTQPLSQFRGCKMSDRVRAVAFLTLGKLCLQDKLLAKKCVPAMARELEVCACDDVRNNIVIILRDLCVRYTTLVDPYVSHMACCLRDPAPIVRRQTLELLTGLLQEDYLKWKGALFYRFALTLLDPHPDIAAFAEFCLGFHLLKRHPTMMSQHLLESIFVFNDYHRHNVFNKYPQSERERALFCLKGKENHSQRLQLYRFMLEHMEDEHRFQLTSKISQEVLGVVVDGIVPYDADSCDLLQDALAILSSKEIKLSSLRSGKSVEDAADEMEMAQVVVATARKTLITQVVKRNVMENVIPVVLSLKHMLDKERSPLQKDLMAFLQELMKDYKNEIKEVLATDKQLACEVEYDLRMFENQQANAAGQEQSDDRGATATPVQAPAAAAEAVVQAGSKPGTPGVQTGRLAGGQRTTPSVGAGSNGEVSAAEPARKSGTGATPQPPSRGVWDVAVRQAVLRTVEQLKERRQSSGRKDAQCVSSVKWAEDVIANLSGVSQSDQVTTDKENVEKPQTPRQPPRRPLRAISTPSGLLSNVTFAEETNLTLPLVPPSPIPGSSRSRATVDIMGEDENEVNIISMDLPGVQGQAKPREWRLKVKTEKEVIEATQPAVITSPVVRKTRRSRRLEKSS